MVSLTVLFPTRVGAPALRYPVCLTMHPPAPSHTAPAPWAWERLLHAPHRLSFACAHLLLIVGSLWWLGVQLARIGWWPGGPGTGAALSPTLVHGATMTFGFAPLFFAGFLFTAGPKWLQVEAPGARQLLAGVLLQALGWVLWLIGGQLDVPLALLGGGLAGLGLLIHQLMFLRLIRASKAPDQIHARLIAVAGLLGLLAVGGLLASVATGQTDLGRTFIQSGLWAYVVLVYVTVAHRMIPFFTSSALPMVAAWRPMWVLIFLVIALAHKLITLWFDWAGLDWPVWRVVSSFWMLVTGLVLLWLAFVWGLVQSLRIRLLAMLHIGFLWLGLGFLLDASGHFWAQITGNISWTLGALHITTMGFLGSLLLAMVTRVSCGHGGRTLVADSMVWGLFVVLQVATVTRVAAALLGPEHYALLTVVAAGLWSVTVVPWALRLIGWYGKPRLDGRPG